MPKYIILVTKNDKKLNEHRKIFALHGVDVFKEEQTNPKYIKIATINEQSNLFERKTGQTSARNDMELVTNICTIDAVTSKGVQTNTASVDGHINLSLKAKNPDEVFGWDDIFVGEGNNYTYQMMSEMGMKISARDIALSKFIQEHLYFNERVDSNFFPVNQETSVDFNQSVAEFIKDNKYFQVINDIVIEEYGLKNLVNQVIANGLFFKSAKNRREKNYWQPTLNGGLPLTPKKDDIHEVTYMFHDICHFAVPDLIYDGFNSPDARRIYIIHRMMGEAFTLVLADMLFVHALAKSGVDYDFSKRKIYPLFKSLKLDATLKEILYANVQYCLKGDDREYVRLAHDPNTLKEFKDKYEKFFIEDYRWTDRNYQAFSNNSDIFRTWTLNNLSLIWGVNKTRNIMTLTDYYHELNSWPMFNLQQSTNDELIDFIFERFYSSIQRMLDPNMPKWVKTVDPKTLAFKKYMIGQLVIFDKFDFVPESKYYGSKIRKVLNNKEVITDREIETIRDFYNNYLNILEDNGYITKDDAETYKEVYPLFKPFYVFYDNLEDKQFSSLREAKENFLP